MISGSIEIIRNSRAELRTILRPAGEQRINAQIDEHAPLSRQVRRPK